MSIPQTSSVFLAGVADNPDTSTVLVHLPVAGKVEPGPGEYGGIRGWRITGDCEVVRQGNGAATDHRLDDFEGNSIVIR